MLSLVGLGFGNPEHLTVEGKSILQNADTVYIETYTSKLSTSLNQYKKVLGREVSYVYRSDMEQDMNTRITQAKDSHVAIGIIGDVFSATTHSALFVEAHNADVDVHVSHNTSIFNAISATGLQLYKFGKTTSIVAPQGKWLPHSPLFAVQENLERGLHTMCLLDIKVDEQSEMYMSCQQALDILLRIQDEEDTTVLQPDQEVIFTKDIGTDTQHIRKGTVRNPPRFSADPLQTLVIPGEMHDSEQEMVDIQSRK